MNWDGVFDDYSGNKEYTGDIVDLLIEHASTLEEGIEYLNGEEGYFCDHISEYADRNVSVYYNQLAKWFAMNHSLVNDAIDEFGWDGVGKDIYKAIQMAQYQEIYREASEEAMDMLEYLKEYNADSGAE